MKKILCLLIILLISTGLLSCSTSYRMTTEQKLDLYRDFIKDWQERQKTEGWTDAKVFEVYEECLTYTKYRFDVDDHMDTYKEILQKGMVGDCEDFAIFIYGTFKRLNYPYRIRIALVSHMLYEDDHALIHIELPSGKWEYLETVMMNAMEGPFYKPLFEGDENHIYKPGTDEILSWQKESAILAGL
ncbi:MAG: hypothetical protein ACFFDT_40000 [Candidatus Hodarchaeota archaeon]